MPIRPLGRREFLRRASVTAGTLGLAGSAASLPGCGDSGTAPPAPPAAPSNLEAVPTSAFDVQLMWTDNADDQAGVEVERRSAVESTFTRVATLPAGVTTHVDTGLNERALYTYRVRAVADGRVSNYSNEASATTPAAGAPPPPTGLTATVLSPTRARLTWTDVSTNETGFRVERRDGTTFTTLATLGEGTTFLQLNGLAAAEIYRVRVLATSVAGDSAPSAEVAFFTGAAAWDLVLLPQEPGRLHINWTDLTGGVLGFVVERDAGTGFEMIATTAAGDTIFDDTTFPLGSLVRYRVTANGAASLESNVVQRQIPAEGPGGVADVAAVLSTDNGSQVRLSWSATDAAATTGFEVQRKVGTSAFSRIRLGGSPGEVTFLDTPGVPFVPATYRVRAWNLAGYSPFSDESAVTPRAVFFLTGALAVLGTVNKAASVQILRPSASVGSSCFSPITNVWLVRETEERISAVVAHCTHECLTVPSFHWNEAQRRFLCAHGSQFDVNGRVIMGPARSDVPTLPTELFEGRIEILPPIQGAALPG